MKHIPVSLLILLFTFPPSFGVGQTFQREFTSIPVVLGGRTLQIPWSGGLNTVSVALGDLNGDNSPDMLLTGGDEGRLQLYRNIGGAMVEFVDSAVNSLIIGNFNERLALHDIDGDNDLDLFVGVGNGRIRFYQNEGTVASPSFALLTSFYDSIDVGSTAAPAFGDLNGDSLADLLVGDFDSGILHFQHTIVGPAAFAFVDTLRDTSGVKIKPGGIFFSPALVDVDDDGDNDLWIGSSLDSLSLYENVGSATVPGFVWRQSVKPPGALSFLTPVLADVDGDSDPDLVFGTNEGYVGFYRNIGSPTVPAYSLVTRQLGLDYIDFGFYSSPTFADIDNDGDTDLLVGCSEGGIHFLQNTGTPASPVFTYRTDRFSDVYGGADTSPSWADLDNDGDLDLVMSTAFNPPLLFINSGTSANAQLDSVGLLRDSSFNSLSGTRPAMVDIDGDNDIDMFLVDREGQGNFLRLYRNVGTASSYMFVLEPDTIRDGSGEIIRQFDMRVTFADIDTDGDMDMFLGTGDGVLLYYRNEGTASTPSFVMQSTGFGNIYTGPGYRCIAAIGDVDNDGDLDIVVGRFQGGLLFYRNTSSTGVRERGGPPLSVALGQNYPNPFNPTTHIRYALKDQGHVRLIVYNTLGQAVATLIDEVRSAGSHTAVWNGLNTDGMPVGSGMYLYRLEVDGGTLTKKLLLVR